MEHWQKENLRVNMPQLMENTDCNPLLLTRMQACSILAPSECTTLLSTSDANYRSWEFYQLVQKKLNSYLPLVQALLQTNQTGPADVLMRGIPASSPMRGQIEAWQAGQATPPITNVPLVTPAHVNTPTPTQLDNSAMVGAEDDIDFTYNMTPLQISVTRPTVPTSFADDEYLLPHDFKGFALVLNITEFLNQACNRGGASLDTKYMVDLWTQLGYKVTERTGCYPLQEVDKILEEFKAQFSCLSPSDRISCVIFIGSHGTFSKIESSDHQEIDLYRHVIYRFDANNCPQLRGRPKIFLIQACQRFQTDDAAPPANRTDMDSVAPTPIDDAVVSFSTMPGWPANRDLHLGTWYGYCLAKVIMENAWSMDLLKMLKKTQETMRRINGSTRTGQLSTYMDLGIKTVYFNMTPGANN